MPIEPIWGYQGILHESEGFMRDWHNRANLGLSVDLSKLLLYLHS